MTALTATQARNVAAAMQARLGALPGNWPMRVGWNGSSAINGVRLIDGLETVYRRGAAR